jgi:prevent-host-death family protein
MQMVNMHEAKTHLSRLVAAAADGEPFVIARAGTPLVKVMAVDAPAPGRKRRVGFMEGRLSVPDDFDRMGVEEVAALFEADA